MNVDAKIPTKQDVADAVAKADKDMAEALKPTGKDDPMNDPALSVENANLRVPTEATTVGPKEMEKANVKADKAKKEEAKVAAEAEKVLAK